MTECFSFFDLFSLWTLVGIPWLLCSEVILKNFEYGPQILITFI